MSRSTMVGSLLVLCLAGRADAQLLDVQTQIYFGVGARPSVAAGFPVNAIPPIGVLVASPPNAVEASGAEAGITVRRLRPDEAVLGRAVVVESVAADGAGLRAGLRPGDVISFYSARGGDDDLAAFERLLHSAEPGQALGLVVIRDGVRMMVSITPRPAGSDDRR